MRYDRKRELNSKNVCRKQSAIPSIHFDYGFSVNVKGCMYALYQKRIVPQRTGTSVTTFYELYDRPLGHGGHLILFDVVKKPAWRTYYCLKS